MSKTKTNTFSKKGKIIFGIVAAIVIISAILLTVFLVPKKSTKKVNQPSQSTSTNVDNQSGDKTSVDKTDPIIEPTSPPLFVNTYSDGNIGNLSPTYSLETYKSLYDFFEYIPKRDGYKIKPSVILSTDTKIEISKLILYRYMDEQLNGQSYPMILTSIGRGTYKKPDAVYIETDPNGEVKFKFNGPGNKILSSEFQNYIKPFNIKIEDLFENDSSASVKKFGYNFAKNLDFEQVYSDLEIQEHMISFSQYSEFVSAFLSYISEMRNVFKQFKYKDMDFHTSFFIYSGSTYIKKLVKASYGQDVFNIIFNSSKVKDLNVLLSDYLTPEQGRDYLGSIKKIKSTMSIPTNVIPGIINFDVQYEYIGKLIDSKVQDKVSDLLGKYKNISGYDILRDSEKEELGKRIAMLIGLNEEDQDTSVIIDLLDEFLKKLSEKIPNHYSEEDMRYLVNNAPKINRPLYSLPISHYTPLPFTAIGSAPDSNINITRHPQQMHLPNGGITQIPYHRTDPTSPLSLTDHPNVSAIKVNGEVYDNDVTNVLVKDFPNNKIAHFTVRFSYNNYNEESLFGQSISYFVAEIEVKRENDQYSYRIQKVSPIMAIPGSELEGVGGPREFSKRPIEGAKGTTNDDEGKNFGTDINQDLFVKLVGLNTRLTQSKYQVITSLAINSETNNLYGKIKNTLHNPELNFTIDSVQDAYLVSLPPSNDHSFYDVMNTPLSEWNDISSYNGPSRTFKTYYNSVHKRYGLQSLDNNVISKIISEKNGLTVGREGSLISGQQAPNAGESYQTISQFTVMNVNKDNPDEIGPTYKSAFNVASPYDGDKKYGESNLLTYIYPPESDHIFKFTILQGDLKSGSSVRGQISPETEDEYVINYELYLKYDHLSDKGYFKIENINKSNKITSNYNEKSGGTELIKEKTLGRNEHISMNIKIYDLYGKVAIALVPDIDLDLYNDHSQSDHGLSHEFMTAILDVKL